MASIATKGKGAACWADAKAAVDCLTLLQRLHAQCVQLRAEWQLADSAHEPLDLQSHPGRPHEAHQPTDSGGLPGGCGWIRCATAPHHVGACCAWCLPRSKSGKVAAAGYSQPLPHAAVPLAGRYIRLLRRPDSTGLPLDWERAVKEAALTQQQADTISEGALVGRGQKRADHSLQVAAVCRLQFAACSLPSFRLRGGGSAAIRK